MTERMLLQNQYALAKSVNCLTEHVHLKNAENMLFQKQSNTSSYMMEKYALAKEVKCLTKICSCKSSQIYDLTHALAKAVKCLTEKILLQMQ